MDSDGVTSESSRSRFKSLVAWTDFAIFWAEGEELNKDHENYGKKDLLKAISCEPIVTVKTTRLRTSTIWR